MMLRHTLAFFFACLLGAAGLGPVTHSVAAAGVRYAKEVATGTQDCLSWANACTLQTALTGAVEGDEIWVAAGTHTPGTDRSASFRLINGVALYGGFTGAETRREGRDFSVNETILSGDIGLKDDVSDNVYHVVTGSEIDNTAVLDGFTITGGNANGDYPDTLGGGLYLDHGNPTLANLTVRNNTALVNGGGILNGNSSPKLTNVVFRNNSALSSGGGMANWNLSHPVLKDVVFANNSALYDGGGMVNHNQSSPTLNGVVFIENAAVSDGGGMSNYADSHPVIVNVTFRGNSAHFGGGMMNRHNCSPILTNVTFSGNSATSLGGGLCNFDSSSPTIWNSIFWGNTADLGPQIFIDDSVTIVSSVIQGGCPDWGMCGRVIDTDPLLGSIGVWGGSVPSIPLLPGSPAIDAGDNTVCPAVDSRGLPRNDGRCDIGAYEWAPRTFYLPLVAR